VHYESAQSPSPVFDPKTWVDLMTAYAAKKDLFSARTLAIVLDGIEKLAAARAEPGNGITVTAFHATLFERLRGSFNNATVLKEVGLAYQNEFHLPGVALKHFELARQFAPKDRELEQLQKNAALALARQATENPSHTDISEITPAKPELAHLLRKTTRIDIGETRRYLTATASKLRLGAPPRAPATATPTAAPAAIDFTTLLERAQRLIQQTNFAGASAALAQAQAAGAPREELQAFYSQLGLAAFDHSRMEEALSAFQATRDLGPEAVEGWFNCALVYQKIGRLEEALQSYQEAARLAPENAKIWSNISSVWFETGHYAEAEAAARRALELNPEYPRAWDNLAATLSAVNRLPEAAVACQSAIRLQPSLQSAWFKLGVIHFQQENLLAAREAFSLTGDSVELFPFVLFYFSMIEARRGELDLALQKLEEARAADPDNDLEIPALKEIAAACTRFGRHLAAAGHYRQAVDKKPDDFTAWLALGAALHRAEEIEGARRAYEQAIGLQPDNHLPWHNLGLLAADAEDHEEARRCFEREIELCPDDPKAWYDLGLSLQNLHLERESAEAFGRAEELVSTVHRRTSDISAALSIVRRLNLGERTIKDST
jgi:tetratricopeptide (TPR) repeat protein